MPIRCYCTVGGDSCLNETCSIPNDGFCYAYVGEKFDDETQQYVDERHWGCLAGEEGALMQCRGAFSRHIDPKAMVCCRPNITAYAQAEATGAFMQRCNQDLYPEYVRRPDQERTVTLSQMISSLVSSPVFMWISGFLTLFLVFTFCLTLFYYCCHLFWRHRRRLFSCCMPRDDKGGSHYCADILSTGSSDDSIIKEKHLLPPDYLSATAGIIVPPIIKSAPICDDDLDTLKIDMANSASSMSEITSGHGGLLLDRRTIARDIQLLELVGQGRFGEVRRALFKSNEIAVKIFKSWEEASFRREDHIYTNYLKPHDNILGFFCSDMISRNGLVELWLVTHYCSKRSLHEYLIDNTLSFEQALDVVYCIINGLHYLHTNFDCQTNKPGIAHRDLKSKNILMKCDNVACIADFGHAFIELPNGGVDRLCIDKLTDEQALRVGTKRYMAPEVLDLSMANPDLFASYKMADVYQFGLVVWEICRRTYLPAPKTNELYLQRMTYGLVIDPPSYMLPYGDIVPDDPSIEQMIKVVCEQQYRPRALEFWYRDTIFTALITLMEECWRPAPTARLSTYNIKKKILDLKGERTLKVSTPESVGITPSEASTETTGSRHVASFYDSGVSL